MNDYQYAELVSVLMDLLLAAGLAGAVGAALCSLVFSVAVPLISGAPMPLTPEQEEKLIAKIRATAAYERSRKK